MITRMSSSLCQHTKMLQLWLYFPWIRLWLILFGNWKFVPLTCLTYFFPSLSASQLSSVSLTLFLFIYFYISCISEIIHICLFLSDIFHLAQYPIVHSCHKWQDWVLLLAGNIPLYVYVTSFSIRLLMSTYIAYVLAIVDNLAVNIEMCISFLIVLLFSLDKC